MFQSKKAKSLRGIHARKFHLRTDVSRDTRYSRTWNTQLPRVIAGLVDMLNHAHWLRIDIVLLFATGKFYCQVKYILVGGNSSHKN